MGGLIKGAGGKGVGSREGAPTELPSLDFGAAASAIPSQDGGL